MSQTFSVITPIDGSVLLERAYASDNQVAAALTAARDARHGWRATTLTERIALVGRAVDWLVANKVRAADAITRQIGRPISQSPGEIGGLEERARYMMAIADEGLADIRPTTKAGFERFLRRKPLGTVLVLAPWNYPFLTAINTLVPALIAGNTVILKHSSQTPLVAELFDEAFRSAGLPAGVFQILHLDHDATLKLVGAPEIDFVAFTGSVDGGRAVQQAAGRRFIGVGLELGGKDPAYVRNDADLPSAIDNLVDGAFFNAGQSCCAVERIYVHRRHYKDFVDGFVELTRAYRFGNPLDSKTNLGPMVRASAADSVRRQIAAAVTAGAKALIPAGHFAVDAPGSAYLAPQVLVGVDHTMSVMCDESFGPVIGIMPVNDDLDAVRLMNDSRYGLTASIWTRDRDAAIRFGEAIDTGTVFMNRCDYLDPALAWTGAKDSGRGVSLSVLGYAQLTRVKSFHLKG
ncbi:aldehyde dehydrogenase family protein [Crenobacter sp. SG2303]|uniref:Aldehyde dehydrogenase family protein n=1 Tax=Crenobacter oryzisoli TaxID=3056844 RepID=A0ABT7XUJ4_9NEIS|nr:aldehyde dehydrogenase family protein [Crenobacter sp. SG2303]MDN0077408.1 aldehyde dehydrogenase family protein [Crenobacter sp. SG2303]